MHIDFLTQLHTNLYIDLNRINLKCKLKWNLKLKLYLNLKWNQAQGKIRAYLLETIDESSHIGLYAR